MLLHRVLVLAQDFPTLGEPAKVSANHIHEYVDLPGAEGAAMRVPSTQFFDQLIELHQDLKTVLFDHSGLSLDVTSRTHFLIWREHDFRFTQPGL